MSHPNQQPTISRRAMLGIFVASIAGGVLLTRLALPVIRTGDSSPRPDSDSTVNNESNDPKNARSSFYDTEVEPRVFETDLANREAAERALERLSTTFDGYHEGVDKFVSDLTSISTRLGIVRRMPGQWWAGDRRIDDFVREKFEQHLFSERKLLADVGEVLKVFQDDVDTNQRRMLTQIRAALTQSDLPQVSMSTDAEFYQAVASKLQSYSSDQGSATVYNALTVLLISEAGSYVATSLLAGLVARFGTTAAVSTVAASGATAGTATVGAGGGTLGGPVGVVVGFGVGLAVGLIIDWWMTEKFETEMSTQMNAYLDSLERTIVTGDSAKNPGLADAMPVVCDRLLDAYRERFYEQIVTGD